MGGDATEILREIRERVQRIEELLVSARERSALPLRARTALARARGRNNLRGHALMPHAGKIAGWLEAGRTQQQVLQLLAAEGIAAKKSSLSQFIRGRLMVEEGDSP